MTQGRWMLRKETPIPSEQRNGEEDRAELQDLLKSPVDTQAHPAHGSLFIFCHVCSAKEPGHLPS